MYKDLLQRYKVAKISFLNLSQNMVTFSVIPVSANNDLHTGNNGLHNDRGACMNSLQYLLNY